MRIALSHDQPRTYEPHRLSGSIVVNIAFGLRVKETNDPILEIAQVANDYMLQGAVPGAFLVDALPFLKYIPDWFPGAGFQKYGAIGKEAGNRLRDIPFDNGKAAIVSLPCRSPRADPY